MKNALLAILLCGVAVAACDANRKEAVEADKAAQISIDTAAADDQDRGGQWTGERPSGVDIKADMETGEVELKLPGGIEGKVNIPAGIEADTKFDLDGLGRYPGAKLSNVNVQAGASADNGKGQVVLGFTAPGTAGQVADWYGKALSEKGRFTSRTGNTLTGTTKDGDTMVIAVNDGAKGVARGQITITDKKG